MAVEDRIGEVDTSFTPLDIPGIQPPEKDLPEPPLVFADQVPPALREVPPHVGPVSPELVRHTDAAGHEWFEQLLPLGDTPGTQARPAAG